MKLPAPSGLSAPISSGSPSLLASLHQRSLNAAFKVSAAAFGQRSSDAGN